MKEGYQTLQRNANIAWNNPCQEQSVHIFGHTPKKTKQLIRTSYLVFVILLYFDLISLLGVVSSLSFEFVSSMFINKYITVDTRANILWIYKVKGPLTHWLIHLLTGIVYEELSDVWPLSTLYFNKSSWSETLRTVIATALL